MREVREGEFLKSSAGDSVVKRTVGVSFRTILKAGEPQSRHLRREQGLNSEINRELWSATYVFRRYDEEKGSKFATGGAFV